MSECDSSDQAVSVGIVVVVVGVNFLVFRLLLSNRCTDLLQILCGCSLGGPLLSLLKSGCYTYFFMELWVILCNFWPILQKSSIKPLTRNHSYLVWRVPRGLVSSLFKLGHCDLHLRFLLTIFVKHIFDFSSQTAAWICF